MFNLHFKNERPVVNTSICMGRVLCTYFISYKTACNSPHKSTTDFFKCYPTRYVTIRLHAIARRHDDKTERHFMESINNIFFKIKFHTQKNLKSTKKKEKSISNWDYRIVSFYYFILTEFFNNKYIIKNCANWSILLLRVLNSNKMSD